MKSFLNIVLTLVKIIIFAKIIKNKKMKTMKNWLPLDYCLVVSTVFSQGKLQELLLTDKASLPGANVAIKGTKTGVSDFDGKFSINTTVNSEN
jgi:hypothetical protein